jgi:hypothetical protein
MARTAITSARSAGSTGRRAGTLLLGAAASGALAVGALSQAGQANATCLSVSGFDIGKGCTSTQDTIAVAIGPGATASAIGGLFGSAFALGKDASASSTVVGTAVAVGNGANAQTDGLFGTAIAVDTSAKAQTINNCPRT